MPWIGLSGSECCLSAVGPGRSLLTEDSFSTTHGPTAEERALMYDWIQTLVAFVHQDNSYEFGTKTIEEIKVVTPDGRIDVLMDDRWGTLTKLGEVFARG